MRQAVSADLGVNAGNSVADELIMGFVQAYEDFAYDRNAGVNRTLFGVDQHFAALRDYVRTRGYLA